MISGFYVDRMLNELGEITGFGLFPAEEMFHQISPVIIEEANCFLRSEGNKRTRNLSVFECLGLKLLREACSSQGSVVLLDEIGGVELLSEEFTEELIKVIQQPKKIIGVFKSEHNYRRQQQNSLEPLNIDLQRERLRKTLAESGQLVTVTKDNLLEVRKQLTHFLKR